MTGPAPVAPVPVPPQPTPSAAVPSSAAPEPGSGVPESTSDATEAASAPPTPAAEGTDEADGPSDGAIDEGLRPDPLDEHLPPDPYDEGAQPDPFADATPARPDASDEGAPVTARRPPAARASAEALAEAAAGDRLALLRSVFPGRVLRLVPDAPPGGAGGRAPTLDDGDALPLDAPTDADGVGPDPNEPGGSA